MSSAAKSTCLQAKVVFFTVISIIYERFEFYLILAYNVSKRFCTPGLDVSPILLMTPANRLTLFGLHAGAGNPLLFVTVAPGTFQRMRENYGAKRHIGREMLREIPKSWTYISEAWNKYARTPVANAIESVTGGDAESVAFQPYANVKGGKKSKRASVPLTLPKSFDADVYKVAPLVTHFGLYAKAPKELYGSVKYQPKRPEIVHVQKVLKELVAALPSKGLSAREIYRTHVRNHPAFDAYGGAEWEKWFVSELQRSLLTGVGSKNYPTNASRHTAHKALRHPDLIRFVQDLSILTGFSRDPLALLQHWVNTLQTCSSHWCAPPIWWCLGSVLVGSNLQGMTRSPDGDVTMAACLENWDMFVLLKLLQSNIFPEQVKNAAERVLRYTRMDIAHERFDCNWKRDWTCMYDLLHALGCSREAEGLRNCCEPKFQSDAGGADYQMCFDGTLSWVHILTGIACVPPLPVHDRATSWPSKTG